MAALARHPLGNWQLATGNWQPATGNPFMANQSRPRKACDTHLAPVPVATDDAPMCVIRAIFLAALLAFLTAAQATDQGSTIDPNGGTSEVGARIDDNGVK